MTVIYKNDNDTKRCDLYNAEKIPTDNSRCDTAYTWILGNATEENVVTENDITLYCRFATTSKNKGVRLRRFFKMVDDRMQNKNADTMTIIETRKKYKFILFANDVGYIRLSLPRKYKFTDRSIAILD